MFKIFSTIVAVSLLAGAAALAFPTDASAFPALTPDVVTSAPLAVEKTAYFYDGREFCFYREGWDGPGYYLCGFPYRRGFFFAPGFAGFRAGPGFRGGFRGHLAGGHFAGPHAGARQHRSAGHHGAGHKVRHGGGHQARHSSHHR